MHRRAAKISWFLRGALPGVDPFVAQSRLADTNKLHLGCGGNVLPGWSNVDLFGSDYVVAHDLTKPLPVRSGSVAFGKPHGVCADGTQQLPVAGLSAMLSRVALPMFSAAAAERAQMRRGYTSSPPFQA